MSTLTVNTPDGAALKVHRQGRGQTLVLVSGLGGTAAFWQSTIDALGAGYEIVTFDQRGIGASTRGTADVTIEQLSRDVMTICDACGIERAAFLGHSTGGCIVQMLAVIAPELVDRLALSAAWARPSNFMQSLFKFRLKLLKTDPQAYVESAALLSFSPEWLEKNWDRFEPATATPPHNSQKKTIIAERINALLSYDGRALLAHMPPETLVIGTEDDMIVPAFLQRELAGQITDADLHLLADGGHFYPLSQTDVFAAILVKWLQN